MSTRRTSSTGDPTWIALVRSPAPSLGSCELSFLPRVSIDAELAAAQHGSYVRALERSGARVVHLPPRHAMPDGTFVEDALVVVDELAVAARPGPESRRGEVEDAVTAISPHREVRTIDAPATLEGGDVLRLGRSVFVGLSSRTNEAGVSQLDALLRPVGYDVLPVRVDRCLHLKTACSAIDDRRLLINPAWVDERSFAAFDLVRVDRSEPFAANVLSLDGTVVASASHPKTRSLLERAGISVETVDLSELEKAEAGATCLSVLFRERGSSSRG